MIIIMAGREQARHYHALSESKTKAATPPPSALLLLYVFPAAST